MKLVEKEVVFSNADSIKGVFMDLYEIGNLSRYKRCDVLYDGTFRYATMYPEDMTIQSSEFIDYIVKKSDESRLDILAQKFYGRASLYWVIAYFNDIHDPMDVPVGTFLRIPSLGSIYLTGRRLV